MSRWHVWVPLVVLAVLALGAGGLVWAGRDLPPPEFKLTDHGLLAPVNYPAWRRASDWLAHRRYIMLTFDDGPYGDGVDTKILAILARHHAHAVFFEVCAHITVATRHVPRRILATGNMLGNHTYNHRHLPKLGPEALKRQIADCSAKLTSVTGRRPTLFRPPWGQLSPATVKAIQAAGMHVVLWDANSEDTSSNSPGEIIRMSLYETSLGGRILLLHSRPATAKALDALLAKLQQRGFQFVLPSVSNHPARHG
ncbi:MAG TPA: polysaccharide deacetylase family protein [Oleiagrimonas sp.]|nr:polysaccharide deacetylase family protein [Oleiagrimonas sp.]